jgi:hypothetical protein
VLNYRAFHRLFAGQIEKPARSAPVPQKVVPAQGEIVPEGKSSNRIGRAIIVVPRLAWFHALSFHVVLGDDGAGMAQHEFDKFYIVVDHLSRDRRSINQTLLRTQIL